MTTTEPDVLSTIADLERGKLTAEEQRHLARALKRVIRGEPAAQALGLRVEPGQRPLSTRDQLRARNDALRNLSSMFTAASTSMRAARCLKAMRHYAAGRWRFDHEKSEMPTDYRGTPSELLFRAFKAADGNLPKSTRQIRRILATPHELDTNS